MGFFFFFKQLTLFESLEERDKMCIRIQFQTTGKTVKQYEKYGIQEKHNQEWGKKGLFFDLSRQDNNKNIVVTNKSYW